MCHTLANDLECLSQCSMFKSKIVQRFEGTLQIYFICYRWYLYVLTKTASQYGLEIWIYKTT